MDHLTPRQQQVWDYIIRYYREEGYFPELKTIQSGLGFKHINSVHQFMSYLVDKKYLEKKDRGFYRIHPAKYHLLYENDAAEGIPILGRIAASDLREVIEESLGSIPVELTRPKEDTFALQVAGPSMTDAGIEDGDYILLEKRSMLAEGEIGAIRYQGETTLKRISRKEGKIILQPENERFDPIVIDPDEFEEVSIIGRYVGKATKEPGGWQLFLKT